MSGGFPVENNADGFWHGPPNGDQPGRIHFSAIFLLSEKRVLFALVFEKG